MKKVVSYLVMLIGLAAIALGVKNIRTATSEYIPFIAGINPIVLPIAGIILIIAGISLLGKKESESKVKHAGEEVPIFEGAGKKKRIIGYKKISKK